MTLITAKASQWFAIQVTDRLLTRAGAEFDPVSNKNVIYEAPDVLVAIGYTGDAYLDELPTDEWLAQTLIGETFGSGEGRATAIRFGPLPHWRHIGPALEMLRVRLVEALQRVNARDRRFELMVTGWQWQRRRRPRPILLSLEKPPGVTTFTVRRSPRHLGLGGFFFGITPEQNVSADELLRMRIALRDVHSADDAERILVNTVREVATRNPVVGPHCMSILIPPPWHPHVRVRYVSEEVPTVGIRGRNDNLVRATAPAAYSPWVIGPRLVAAPSIMAGPTELGLGRYSVRLEAPAMTGATPGLLGAMGAVERPPMPR